jgi:hypothetical protein
VLIGFYKFLRGERYARWEPIRENKMEINHLDAELQTEVQLKAEDGN